MAGFTYGSGSNSGSNVNNLLSLIIWFYNAVFWTTWEQACVSNYREMTNYPHTWSHCILFMAMWDTSHYVNFHQLLLFALISKVFKQFCANKWISGSRKTEKTVSNWENILLMS